MPTKPKSSGWNGRPEMPLLRIGAVCGAILTLITFFSFWPKGWTPALTQEIERLEQNQLDAASEIYQQKLDSLTILGTKLKTAPDVTQVERNLIQKQIDETERKINEVEQRKLELAR